MTAPDYLARCTLGRKVSVPTSAATRDLMMRSVSVYQDLISHYYLGAFLLRAALPSGVSFKAPIFFASVLSICTVVPAAPDSLFRLLNSIDI